MSRGLTRSSSSPFLFATDLPFDLLMGQRRLTRVVTPLAVWYNGHEELLSYGALDIEDFRRISRRIKRGNDAFYVVSAPMARQHGTPTPSSDRLCMNHLRPRIGPDELEQHADYVIIKDFVFVRDGVPNGLDFFRRHELLPDITEVRPLSSL